MERSPFSFCGQYRQIRLMFEGMIQQLLGERSKLAVLIDPDQMDDPNLERLMDHLALGLADVILVGGSTSRVLFIDDLVRRIKARTGRPSLISGRNPDYLIGKHVESAHLIKQSGLEVIPMGYILVDGGKVSTTAYVTQTAPIPTHLAGLVADTALAGELLGMKCIYLEAGSGADQPAHVETISTVKKQITIPLIVGGGIKSPTQLLEARTNGADMVVLGSVLEEHPDQLIAFHEAWTSQVISS